MKYIARILFLCLLALLLYGCKSIKYVPVESIKHDTTRIVQTKVDSIYQKDSIYIYGLGDTVFVTKYKYKYKTVEKVDTFWHERRDTIHVTQTVTVEKPLTIWQKARMRIGSVAIIIAAVAILYLIFRRKLGI